MFARNDTKAEWMEKSQYSSILISCYVTNKENVGFEVFTAVVLKSIIFWGMTP
jgi:hypothetical protein